MSDPSRPLARRRPVAADAAAAVLEVVPQVMNVVRSSMRRGVGDALSVPQFRCLGYISRNPATSISAVATFLGVTLATASALVERLSRAGYVATATAAADRRRTELSILEPGRLLMEQFRQTARQDITAALADTSKAELAAIIDGLAVLKRKIRRV